MYVYLLWLTVSNLCQLITAIPVFWNVYDGSFSSAVYQVFTLSLVIN